MDPDMSDDCPEAPSFHADMHTHILHEACRLVGGISRLAHILCVSGRSLLDWLQGVEVPPPAIVRACMDIVLLHDGDAA
jgi:hypothetical protein